MMNVIGRAGPGICNNKTAVRMVGHLLEHHPTTGTGARDKHGLIVSPMDKTACSWCAVGAAQAVANVLNIYVGTFWDDLESWLGAELISEWEGLGVTDEDRLAFARKLQRYGE